MRAHSSLAAGSGRGVSPRGAGVVVGAIVAAGVFVVAGVSRGGARKAKCEGCPLEPGTYRWAVEHDGECIGSARLVVDPDQHCATYAVGVFVADLRGRGLGREVTRLVLAWGFDVLGVHRIQLEVLANNRRAISCYLACGFRREGVRRDAQLYPDGWKDFILMGLLKPEYARLGEGLATVPQ